LTHRFAFRGLASRPDLLDDQCRIVPPNAPKAERIDQRYRPVFQYDRLLLALGQAFGGAERL
jgi:hypothetical protein